MIVIRRGTNGLVCSLRRDDRVQLSNASGAFVAAHRDDNCLVGWIEQMQVSWIALAAERRRCR